MNNRERYFKTMRFETVDHPPFMLPGGPWKTTLSRWEKEGLPPGADLYEYFGVEPFVMRHVGIETLLFPPFEERIIETTGEFVIKIDSHGVKCRNFKDESSMSEHLEYPIKGPEDVEWLIDRLEWKEERIRKNWVVDALNVQRGGGLVLCNGGTYFAFLNERMGTEALLYAYFDHPEFIHKINNSLCRLCEKAITTVVGEIELDIIGYHEDMAYKNGSIISPDMFREFMTPYYNRIAKIASKHGIDLHLMDSDGDISELIPLWFESGITGVCPVEVAAGMDVVELRKKYGRQLKMHGGFDKRILAADKRAIEREFRRLSPVIKGGGYLPACDHGVPHDVPFENYVCLVELMKSLYGI